MAVVITTASKVSAEAMHAAMLRGFSDYVVPMQPTFAQFETMLARRSFVPALSFVAEEGGEVVAIWLVGRRGDRGYLIASATAPEARGQGLARGLAERSFEALGAAGVSAMQTEVIKGNAAATALYLGLGFEVSRELSCFALPASEDAEPLERVAFEGLARSGFLDWAPSWQNADAALAAEPAPVCLGVRDGDAVQGYAVLLPESGSIAQIGVAPGFRRQGVGARLVLGCRAELAGGALRLINAEAGDAGFAAFVTAMGGEPTVAQLELLKPL